MKLRAYLAEEEITIKSFCESIGYSSSYVRFAMRGEILPSEKLCRVISMATSGKISPKDFYDQCMAKREAFLKKKSEGKTRTYFGPPEKSKKKPKEENES